MKLIVAIVITLCLMAAALGVGLLAITLCYELSELLGRSGMIVVIFIAVAAVLTRVIYKTLDNNEDYESNN